MLSRACEVGLGESKSREFKAEEFKPISESDSQTPNSAKRREEKVEEYKESKEGNIRYRTTGIDLPGQEFQKICHDILDIDGNGDPILPNLGGEIIRFRSETVEVAHRCLETAIDGKWQNGFESLLYVYLFDLWDATRGNYFECLRRGQLPVRQSNISNAMEMEINGPRKQVENFSVGES